MTDPTDVTADYEALRHEAGVVELERDVVRMTGPDARDYLDGQLSQDLKALAPGGSALSLLLEPQGKLVTVLRVTSVDDETFVLDTDRGFGEPMVARLERFKLRTRFEVEPLSDWRCVGIRGPKAHQLVPEGGDGSVIAFADWPSLPGVDLLGPAPAVPDGIRRCGAEAWETVRIEAGIPRMGRELTDRSMPHEGGRALLDATVSFTKGCYTGQELVARVDSRGGNVPRRLLGVVVTANVLPPVGAVVRAGGADAGTLTAVGESLERRAPVALALVKRDVEAGADVTVAWEGGEAPGRVEDLPLVH